MAEFCPECMKRYHGYYAGDQKKYVLSKDLDLCEGCGEWKRVVVRIKRDDSLLDFILRIVRK